MNGRMAARIRDLQLDPGSLAIFWIAQAGFVFKTPGGKVLYIDPYLSDCGSRMLGDVMYGFKRLMMSPIEPEEVEADYVICTHSHLDHFDYDAIPIIAKNPRVHFVTAPDCRAEFEKLNIPVEKYTIIQKGQTLDLGGGISLTGAFADHGDLAPEALGIIFQVGTIRVWHTGDSAYRPDMWQDIFRSAIDVIIAPINGAFGNLDGIAAARLAHDAGVRYAIPCHFWMFAEHNGNPAQFLEACKELAPAVKPLLMSQGEVFICRAATP